LQRIVSKKDGVYEEVIDDIMNLQKKYCSTDDPIGTQKSTVRDPVPVKGRGAPKKRKTDTKTIRRGGRCDNTTHNARSCSVILIIQDFFVRFNVLIFLSITAPMVCFAAC
jgi:hypothetical protein